MRKNDLNEAQHKTVQSSSIDNKRKREVLTIELPAFFIIYLNDFRYLLPDCWLRF